MNLLIATLVSSAASSGLARCIAAEARKLDFSGVVAIVRPDGPIEFAQGPNVRADSRFNLASAGKMFTAVAVAQLADAGKVRLDDPIGARVKGLTPEAAAVTVRQLLTHTSGLGNFFAPENLEAIRRARTASELLPLVAADKPSFAPGSRVEYSNSGFVLLGILVERVSGQSYGEYLEEHVFRPAGMMASGLSPGSGPAGMTRHDGGGLRPAPEASLYGNPAGGSYSTAQDLEKFFAALLGGKLVSAAAIKDALGFGAGAFEGHRWLGHNGGAPGVNVETAAFPDDRTTVIVLSNRDPPAATTLFRKLRSVLFDSDATTCAP